MIFSPKLDRRHYSALLCGVATAFLGWALLDFRLGSAVVTTSYDLLHVFSGDSRVTGAVLVYLDEKSHQDLNQPQNAPWDRALHARLVQRLTQAGARVVVFDVVFTDPDLKNPAADQELAHALEQNGKVVLAADHVLTGPGVKQVIPPFDLLRDKAAALGSDEVVAGADMVVREHTPQDQLPSLSWAGAALAGSRFTSPDAATTRRWLRYYGPPNFLPWRSYSDALDPVLVSDQFFAGKAVFIGATVKTRFAGERKDQYRNPYSSSLSGKMRDEQGALFTAGVELQATAYLNLVRGDWLRRWSTRTEKGLAIALGFLVGCGLVFARPFSALIAAVALVAGIFVTARLLFSHQLTWIPWLVFVVQAAVALAWSIVFNSLRLYVEKRLYEQTLRIYLPPALVKKFAASREFLKPGAHKQTVTLFFSDIADFTTLSEGMDSDSLASLMNAYFQGAVSQCIHKTDGTVAKYIGDAIFAFWNAPEPQADHALRACEAALLFGELNTVPVQGRLLPTRIGLHTGTANVGNFGSNERVDYTALGENVNLASRLEGLNKHLGTRCLISSATQAELGGRLLTRRLGKFQLKGFVNLVEVYELTGGLEEEAPTRPWREAFEQALANYEGRNLEFARMGFERVLELRPGDGPASFYLKTISELATKALDADWVTHTIVKEK